jgi:tetratricopeptide (TPR) repeat protein
MRLMTRIAALHGAYWGIDRWYRLSWYVWPGALALLICGWICIDKAGGVTFPANAAWGKPILPNAKNTSKPVDWLRQATAGCFSNGTSAILQCSGLINSVEVKDRQLAAVYVQRGFLQRQWPDLALSDYNAALKVQPDFADALCGRAWVHMTRAEYDAALEDLNKAIDLTPAASSGIAHYYRGYAFLRLENYARALADLNDAQKFQPNNADVYLARGEVEQAQGEYDAALWDYDEFSKRAPKDPRGSIKRSSVLEVTGRTDDALAALETALALEPGNQTVLAERDRLRAQHGERPAAK